MKTEELIIDGFRVDMSPDTRIVLNFKSNLLGDISKITASNSQTISLPKTIRNREIFNHATAPAYPSTFRYRRHSAEYSRNGVKIISDAYAVLLDSGENFEIALYWGEMTKFQSWVESGLSIKNLDFSDIYQIWKNPVTLATCFNGDSEDDFYFPTDDFLFYVDYDCGLGSAETMSESAKQHISLHPVLSARRILLKMQEESGITFEFPAGFMTVKPGGHSRSEVFRGLAIPMLTRKTSEQQKKSATVTGYAEYKNSMDRYRGLLLSLPASEHYTTETKSYDLFFGGSVNATAIKFSTTGHARFDIFLIVQTAVSFWNKDFPGIPVLELGTANGIRPVPCKVSREKVGHSTGWDYYATGISYTFDEDVESGDEIALLLQVDRGTEFYKYYSDGETFVSPYFLDLYPPVAEVDISLGDYFRVNGNLPDVKQIDFIKALCAMYGLFVVPSGVADKLKFVSLDDLVARKADAVDWSSRVIRTNDGEPERVKYTLGDYARRNFFRYAEDGTVDKDATGEIDVNNEGLEPTKDIITLPFAASDETIVNTEKNLSGALIKQYKFSDDGTTVEANNLKPRILQIVSDGTVQQSGTKAIGRFVPLTFDKLIAKYQRTLAEFLNNAITITERIRLTEYELLNLDFTRPVFLRQYGRYYGIVSVQTGEDYCTVELLQFPAGDAVTPTLLYSINGGDWVANLQPWSGSLKVKTVFGGAISTEDISNFGAVMSGPDMGVLDLRDCNFVGNTLYIASTNVGERYSLEYISELYLPFGIQTISERAFEISRGVREYHFQTGLKEVAYMAFSYNYGLEVIEFPEGIEKIGGYAFYMCHKLATIIFNNPIPPQIVSTAFSQMGQLVPEGTPKRIIIPSGTYALYSTVEAFSYLISGQGYTIEER